MIWPLLLLPLIPTIFRFLFACHVSLINLRSADDYAILPFSPNDLSVSDVVLIVCLFIGRSIKKALGFKSGARPKPSLGQPKHDASSLKEKDTSHDEIDSSVGLQRLELAMPLHIRSNDLDQYMKSISTPSSSPTSSQTQTTQKKLDVNILLSNPTHLILFLSAISEPALLLLLARKGCPIEPLGAVNARNHFELLRPDICKQIIQEASTTPPLKSQQSRTTIKPPNQGLNLNLENSVLASLPPTIRPVKRGTEIDITVSIYSRAKNTDTQSWGPNVEVFRQIFTILQFGSSSTSTSPNTSSEPDPTSLTDTHPNTLDSIPTLASYISLTSASPLLWANLTKDYNPIHISHYAARAFGFKGVIAHGNHVVAKALTTFTTSSFQLQADTNTGAEEGGMYIDVGFKRPIVVPCEMGVRQVEAYHGTSASKAGRDTDMRVEVFKDEKVYIDIEIGRLLI